MARGDAAADRCSTPGLLLRVMGSLLFCQTNRAPSPANAITATAARTRFNAAEVAPDSRCCRAVWMFYYNR